MLERIFRRLWNLGKNMDRMLEETESPKYRTECRKQNQYEYRVLFDDTIEIIKFNGDEECVTVPIRFENKPVSRIGYRAFAGRFNLKKVIIPDGVTSIANSAFAMCHELIQITLPDSLRNIELLAFYDCESLEVLCLPRRIEIIGFEAFRDCYSLIRVEINSNLKHIEDRAFVDCHDLESINIPASVERIGEDAFLNCGDLVMTVCKESYAVSYAKENDIDYRYSK